MPSLSRQQLIAWGIVALVVLLIGANYLRGHLGGGSGAEQAAGVTMGLREEKPARIKIHVVGAVASPGLYETDAGARVADVLKLAGGPTADADLAKLNLAAKVADGQQLLVPGKSAAPAAGAGGSADVGSDGAGGSAGGPSEKGSGQPVNLNSATAAELEALDGVGPKTAQKIIEYREANGGFRSIDELMEVPGIGPAKFEKLKGQVVV